MRITRAAEAIKQNNLPYKLQYQSDTMYHDNIWIKEKTSSQNDTLFEPSDKMNLFFFFFDNLSHQKTPSFELLCVIFFDSNLLISFVIIYIFLFIYYFILFYFILFYFILFYFICVCVCIP